MRGPVQRYATPSQWKAKEVRLSFLKGEGMNQLCMCGAGGGSHVGRLRCPNGAQGAPKPSFYKRRHARTHGQPHRYMCTLRAGLHERKSSRVGPTSLCVA